MEECGLSQPWMKRSLSHSRAWSLIHRRIVIINIFLYVWVMLVILPVNRFRMTGKWPSIHSSIIRNVVQEWNEMKWRGDNIPHPFLSLIQHQAKAGWCCMSEGMSTLSHSSVNHSWLTVEWVRVLVLHHSSLSVRMLDDSLNIQPRKDDDVHEWLSDNYMHDRVPVVTLMHGVGINHPTLLLLLTLTHEIDRVITRKRIAWLIEWMWVSIINRLFPVQLALPGNRRLILDTWKVDRIIGCWTEGTGNKGYPHPFTNIGNVGNGRGYIISIPCQLIPTSKSNFDDVIIG